MRKQTYSTVCLTSFLALTCTIACSSPQVFESVGDSDHESETLATEQKSASLRSSVDCTEQGATAYVQGTPKPIRVITVGGKKVTRATGHAFLRMQRAANDAGVYLSLNSGFRSMAEQEYLYGCYLSGNCNGGNLAARPGYSNHQSGIAVDVSTSDWLANHGEAYGFERTVPSEAWHWEFTGSDPGGPCSGGDVTWISPKDGGSYTNGIWFKSKATGAARVTYSAGEYLLGESSNAGDNFAVRYTFNSLGSREITARVYSSGGSLKTTSTIQIRVSE
jgi:hypothetical protein